MMKLPKPDRTVIIGNWKCEVYEQRQEIWCISTQGRCLIIRNTVHQFNSIPKYVLSKLSKMGLLDQWREHQTKESVQRLNKAIKRYEEYLDKVKIGVA